MTYEEFMNEYCLLCGTQRCASVYDEFYREGCKHYRREFMGEQEQKMEFEKCKICKGSGVDPNGGQCKTCYGFGTVAINKEKENETSF